MKIKNNPLSLVICIVFLGSCLLTVFNLGKFKSCSVLDWDKSGYHLYLPATFIYNDLTEVKFYPKLDSQYHLTSSIDWYGLHSIENSDNRVNKYTCGVALFELPSFLIAHTYATISTKYLADGYSSPYQLGAQLSCVLISFLGLILLRLFLLEHGFKDVHIAVVLLLIGFGTNFYFYAAFDQGMSHSYSFFLISAVLLLTQRIYKQKHLKYFVLLGIAIGWAALIRPVDILILLIPLLWLGFTRDSFSFMVKNKWKIMLAMGCFLIPWIPQLVYWKLSSHEFFFYSYGGEGFNFDKPEIIKGLFSYQKGWFVYTPLTFFGVLYLLLAYGMAAYRKYAQAVIIFFVLYIYIVFSWWMWFYGASYGSRVMINTLPLLAIPLAILAQKLWTMRMLKKISFVILLSFLVSLNIFQSWQYHRNIIHEDSMNGAYYWHIFLQDHYTEEGRGLLKDNGTNN